MATAAPDDVEKKAQDKLAQLANNVVAKREKPLLIMFYYDHRGCAIDEDDVQLLHEALNQGGAEIANPLSELDILIHTLGGDPVGAYRVAQVIRDFTKRAAFLVPEYAYSGGTLVCLSGNLIILGNHAVLSPIDITQHRGILRENDTDAPQFRDEQSAETVVELVAIDNFIKVATQARIEIEAEFRKRDWTKARSEVEATMLCKMIEQMGVVDVAKVFREKNISRAYARELLSCYMFGNRTRTANRVIEGILTRLLTEAPAHAFAMDYHICKDIGLIVEEMSERLSDDCNDLLKHMKEMAGNHILCQEVRTRLIPYFQLFPYVPTTKAEETVLMASKEVSDVEAEGDGNKEERRETTSGKTASS